MAAPPGPGVWPPHRPFDPPLRPRPLHLGRYLGPQADFEVDPKLQEGAQLRSAPSLPL